jgi:hypothetical protein
MQSVKTFKNIQNLSKAPVEGASSESMNALNALEQGMFGNGKNEFQAELSKNINLNDLQKLSNHNSELPPELAADLTQSKTEVLKPTLRRSGIITENSQRSLGNVMSREDLLTEGIEKKPSLDQILRSKKPKSIFTRNVNKAQLLEQAQNPLKVQKGSEDFVHKSILKSQSDKIPQTQVSESENLINLRNMMNKRGAKAINGSSFSTQSDKPEGLISLTSLNDRNLEDESFSQDSNSGLDFLANHSPMMESSQEGPEKVFSMSALTGIDTSDNEAVINKISDYIVNSKIEASNEVQMSVMDDSLGTIDLKVQKAADHSINVVLNTNNQEANLILNQHKNELLSNLTNSGFTVNEIKVDLSSARSNNSSDFSQNFSQNQNQQQFSSKNNQQEQESQKRSQLWEAFRDKEAA